MDDRFFIFINEYAKIKANGGDADKYWILINQNFQANGFQRLNLIIPPNVSSISSLLFNATTNDTTIPGPDNPSPEGGILASPDVPSSDHSELPADSIQDVLAYNSSREGSSLASPDDKRM